MIGRTEDLKQFKASSVQIVDCNIKTFSIKELFYFPKDILHRINSCEAYYTPYCNIPTGIKVPIFSTIHDVVFLDIPGLSSKIGTLVRKCFYQRAINCSKLIFTVSEFSKQRIKETLRCKNKDIIVTYNALPHWFNTENSATEKTDTILFVGNIKRHKGLHTLLPAFQTLIKPVEQNGFGIKAQLLIVGNAENFRTGDKTIIEQIKALPSEQVKFTGRITDSQLRDLYRSSRILVQPSLYEGFGMPPLEALSLGTKVVLSDIPVFREIYQDYPVTFFETENPIDLAEKIASVWNNFQINPVTLPQKYSFEKTSQIIFEQINSKLIEGETK